MKYIATVWETRRVLYEYSIEADSIENAENKAVIGDTEGEDVIKHGEITNRVIDSITEVK